MSSWIAGVQAGCNYQFASRWVIGFEGGWSGTDLNQTNNNVVQSFAGSLQTVRTRIDSIATATARVGYAFTPLWLLYAKGGYAGGDIKTSGRTSPPVGVLALDWDTSQWHNGWTIGAGGEYRVAKNVSVGLEYDFVRLNSEDHVGAVSGGGIGPGNQVVHSVSADVHSVTARVNFLFGSP
jgi:outer membrane immunogenic protein